MFVHLVVVHLLRVISPGIDLYRERLVMLVLLGTLVLLVTLDQLDYQDPRANLVIEEHL